MTTLRVGGVPEHFNLPWHLGLENGMFSNKGIDLQWTTFKGGTGQMTKALREDEIDICILLSEGIVSDITKGNPSKIISKYTNTPLIWGVHTGASNALQMHGEVYNKTYAISRYGSGSHLMAAVDAFQKGRKINDDQWKVIKNLDGALTSLRENETDVFYWEKFTTKPFVTSGQLRRIGEFVTPWPCFVIAATDKVLATKKEAVQDLLKVIYFISKQFMKSWDAIEQVATRYELELQDAEQWFNCTEWSTNNEVSDKMLDSINFTLEQAKIIDKRVVNSSLYVDILK